ncbi:MAG TPA: cell division protein ZipA C-terminal FtsZ-binding domain-containing protein [Steroidobacteraceae bacterium]|jgi:cell division protein ZipA
MPELRVTLLIVGVLFLVGLVVWERRKSHQAAPPHRASEDPHISDAPSARTPREPPLILPEMRAREPIVGQELPIVEIEGDDTFAGLHVETSDDESQLLSEEVGSVEALEPIDPAPEVVDETLAETPHAAGRPIGPADAFGGAEGVTSAPRVVAAAPLPELPRGEEPIVEWPPEQSRKIVALRIVSTAPERFAGRVVRTALVAEGFMLGKYQIFHKPDADNRAVLSAASLSKPGVFDLDTIDAQRFTGLSLFAVLPGPRTPREAFEELLATARNLNERLQGGLQDERGGPLTPTRIASLREGLNDDAMGATVADRT